MSVSEAALEPFLSSYSSDPGEDQIKILAYTGWWCPECKDTTDSGSWYARSFYDQESAEELLHTVFPLKVGNESELVDLFRGQVAEYERHECPGCDYTADDPDRKDYYPCPMCGSPYNDPHEALTCCNSYCAGGQCWCTRGVTRNDNYEFTGLYPSEAPHEIWVQKCRCNPDCNRWVCLVCHDSYTDPTSASNHWFRQHDDADRTITEPTEPAGEVTAPHTRDEPARSPFQRSTSSSFTVPAYDMFDTNPIPACDIEQAGFCCPVHSVHQSPHRGCSSQGDAA